MKNNLLFANRGVLIAGIVCGIVSYAGVELLHGPLSMLPLSQDSGTYWPGVMFGALILAPRVRAAPHRLVRQLASVLVSGLLYYLTIQVGGLLAVELHVHSWLATAVAPSLGALSICLVVRWLIPMNVPLTTWFAAAIVGAFAGAVFGIPTGPNASRAIEAAPLLLGLIIWQAGVGFVLFRQSSSSK